jgi:hypothetical protein
VDGSVVSAIEALLWASLVGWLVLAGLWLLTQS